MKTLRSLLISTLLISTAHAQDPSQNEKSISVIEEIQAQWAKNVAGAQDAGEAAAQERANACSVLEDESGLSERRTKLEEVLNEQETKEKIEHLLNWLRSVYHLEIEFLKEPFESFETLLCPFTGNDRVKLDYLEGLKAELIKLPPPLIVKAELGTIRFSDRIYEDYKEEPSQLAGYVHPDSSYINLVDIWPFFHELFHKIDIAMGTLACSDREAEVSPQKCMAIDDANQKWGELDRKELKLRKNWDEEQAEMSRKLFNSEKPRIYRKQYRPLLRRTGSRQQLDQVKAWLYEWSGGLLNEEYWTDLQNGRVDEAYWRVSH